MAQQNAQNQTGSLADFNFDDEGDFFGIKPSSTDSQTSSTIKQIQGNTINDNDDDLEVTNLDETPSTTVTAAETVKPKKPAGKGKEDIEEEENEEVFNFEDPEEVETKPKEQVKPKTTTKEDEEQEEVVDDKKPKASATEDDENFFTTLATELKEKGVFQAVEIPTDKVLTEDEFFDLQELEIETRVTESFEAFAEGLEDDGKKLIKHLKNGGKVSDFTAVYNTGGIDLEKFDEDDEKSRQTILKYYLTTVEGLDDEELADRLQWYKDGGKEKSFAVKFHKKIKEDIKAKEEALEIATEKAAKQKEKAVEQFNTSIRDVLKKDEISGIVISKDEQKALDRYITEPKVKVGKNRYVPQLQVELADILRAETPEAKANLVLLAKFIKNKFDVSDIKKAGKTEKVKEAQTTLRKSKLGIRTTSSGGSSKKELADFF